MYDWANSVYPLVITTAIFPIFYEAISTTKVDGLVVSDKVQAFGFEFVNTALISYVSAAIFLAVSFLSPMLSGVADAFGRKKTFLTGFYLLGGLSCVGLYFFDINHLEISLIIYFLAGIGFWCSLVFYNAFLPEIAPAAWQDRISAKGYALGYLGSSLLLIVCLGLIMPGVIPAQLAFVLTGIWWIFFAYIFLKRIPENRIQPKSDNGILSKGFKELYGVWKQIRVLPRLKRYLTSFFIYSMGVQTVMLMAVYFGSKEVNWPSDEMKTTGLIVSVLIIQFIAIGGAWILARISEKVGNIKALVVVLVMWSGLCVSALWVTEPIHFYIIAGLVGLVMGGVQSLSRSTYSKLLPKTKDTASFFSFYDVAEKVGIVIGMFSYGFIEEVTGSMRNSIFALIVFFIIGLLVLFTVPKEETVVDGVAA